MNRYTNPPIQINRKKNRRALPADRAIRAALAAAALLLLLSGCCSSGQPAAGPEVQASPTPVAAQASTQQNPQAAASPTPAVSPWVFGEVGSSGDLEINPTVLAALKPRTYTFDEAPTILIYHTHATEAFLQDENYTYEETTQWRTDDNTSNIVYVGEVLKDCLEALGFNVIHDTTNVEPPDIMSAYSRSLEVMEKYPDVDIYIDVHRNAADVERVRNNAVWTNGQECAKMFFVVGTGIGTYEGEYDAAPDWAANYAFASAVTNAVEEAAPDMMKEIRTKVGRYNQHMGLCLLVEVGNNANTMAQALQSIPYLADALGEVVLFDGQDG